MKKNPPHRKFEKKTLEWIESQPGLMEHLNRLREIAEDAQSDLETLEAAERAVLDEVERLGGQALEGWLECREKEVSAASGQQEGLRKHSKKNSG